MGALRLNPILKAVAALGCLATASLAMAADAAPGAPLRAVVFAPAAASAPETAVHGQGAPEDLSPAVDRLRGLLGQPVDEALVARILHEINAQLDRHDQPLTVAWAPAQDTSKGVVRLELQRARVGRVNVKEDGVPGGDPGRVRALMRVQPGDPVIRDALDEDIDWINKSDPHGSAVLVAGAGQDVGTTNLDVVVTHERPWGFSLGYDDAGSRTTGRDRVLFNAAAGELFGTDQQLSYGLVATPDFEHYVGHTVGWVAPLPWRHLLGITASHGDVKGRLPAPFDLRGHTDSVDLRYDVPLGVRGRFSHDLSVGVDYKSSDNNLLFSLTSVSASKTELYQLVLDYTVSLTDDLGSTRASLGWTHSPGGVTARNGDAAFNAARAGARARYDYETLSLKRSTTLPRGWRWDLDLRAQASSANLLGSEQLALGGEDTVRGLGDPLAYGDQGALMRNELFLPTRDIAAAHASVQGSVFVDVGDVSSKDRLPGEPSDYHAASVGVGLRAALPGKASLRVEAAHVSWQRGAAGTSGHALVHVFAQMPF